jgi:hypothetical protein
MTTPHYGFSSDDQRARINGFGAGIRPRYPPTQPIPFSNSDNGTESPLSHTTIKTKQKTSLDFTQRIERKLAEYDASDNVFERWLFEILCLLISAACMIAIIFIYVQIKDQSMSTNESSLTWINVLGKLSSAALIVPTSEALGQLKWNWFHNSKAMWDFEIFDKASRGPLGALMLLYRTKGRSLAALGALLIILLLAIDTFFQQVVSYPERWILQETNGFVARTVRYEPDYAIEYQNGIGVYQQDQNFLATAEPFFLSNGTQPIPFGNGSRADVPLSCPSSRCSWPSYETLGMCTKCIEATNILNFTCMFTRVDWTSELTATVSSYPNATVCGYFLNVTSEAPILMSGYIVNEDGKTTGEALLMRTLPLVTKPLREPLWGDGSIHFKDVRNPIDDFLISSIVNGSDVYAEKAPALHECVLSWCVKTVQSSYYLGTYTEEVTNVITNDTKGSYPWSAYDIPGENMTMTDYLENVTISAPPTAEDFSEYGWGVNNDTMLNTVVIFDRMFPAFTSVTNVSSVPMLRWRTGDPTIVRTKILDFNPWLLPNNVTRHMDRMATAFTNTIRSSSSNEMVAGKAWAEDTIILVEWKWLVFPLLLLVFSSVFLIATMIKTSRDTATGVWKTSAMPTLIYGLPKETQSQFTSSSAFTKAKHNKVRVRLSMKTGWRVSGASYLGKSPQLPRAVVQAPRGWI